MSFNMLKLSGALVCDYVWCINRKLSDSEKEVVSDISYEPLWNKDTDLLVKFNHTLLAGNIDDGNQAPTKWKIYRKEDDSDISIPVAILNSNDIQIVDYNVTNNRTYTYSITAATNEYVTGAILSTPISTKWKNWSLFSADESDIKNQLIVRDMFNFAHNISSSQMNNNIGATKYNNFTRYPKIIMGSSNYYSGTLQCLLGYYDCNKHTYIDSADMLDKLSDFTTDGRRKFLKDIYGHIWEVELTSSLSATPNHLIGGSYYNISLGWTQVGNTEDLSILGVV